MVDVVVYESFSVGVCDGFGFCGLRGQEVFRTDGSALGCTLVTAHVWLVHVVVDVLPVCLVAEGVVAYKDVAYVALGPCEQNFKTSG